MASKKQRQQAIKKRDRRSKIALAACGVIFLGVGAFEVPKIMAQINKKPVVPATPAPSAGSSSAPLPNVAAGTSPATGATPSTARGDLADTDAPPASSAGQLVSFEVFQTKNPFVPQVQTGTPASTSTSTSASPPSTDTTSSAAGGTGASALPSIPGLPTLPGAPTSTGTLPVVPTASGATTGAAGSQASGAAATTTTSTTTGTTTTSASPQPTVAISVNGTVSRVSTNDTFPSGAPVFRLVSYGHGSAQIGIVGGSYQAGAETLALKQGVPVTLQNTTDGKQYRLQLVSTP